MKIALDVMGGDKAPEATIQGAILALERALLFDPDMKTDIFWHLGLAYYLKKRYADSAAVLERNIGRKSNPFWDHLLLAAVYAQMDRTQDAARAAQAVTEVTPGTTSTRYFSDNRANKYMNEP